MSASVLSENRNPHTKISCVTMSKFTTEEHRKNAFEKKYESILNKKHETEMCYTFL